MIKTILLLPVIFLVVSLSALECFTRNGIAANFVDIQGKWCGTEQRVGITPLPEGLRFTFYTGVKNKDYNFIAKAKPDTPAVVGGNRLNCRSLPMFPGASITTSASIPQESFTRRKRRIPHGSPGSLKST